MPAFLELQTLNISTAKGSAFNDYVDWGTFTSNRKQVN